MNALILYHKTPLPCPECGCHVIMETATEHDGEMETTYECADCGYLDVC